MNPHVAEDMLNSRQISVPFQATSTPLGQGVEFTDVIRNYPYHHDPQTPPEHHDTLYGTLCRYKVQIGCGIAAAAVAVGYYWYSNKKNSRTIEEVLYDVAETLPTFDSPPRDVDSEVNTYFGLVGGNKLYEEFVTQGDEAEESSCHYGNYEDDERKNVLGICKCCHQREANSMIIPCGHRFYCDQCSQRVVRASKQKKLELADYKRGSDWSDMGGGVVELRCPYDNSRVNRFMTVA